MDSVRDLSMWYTDTYVLVKGKLMFVCGVTDEGSKFPIEAEVREINGAGNYATGSCKRINARATLDFLLPSPKYIYSVEGGVVWVSRKQANSYCRGLRRDRYTGIANTKDIYNFVLGTTRVDVNKFLSTSNTSTYILSEVVVGKKTSSGIKVGIFGGNLKPIRSWCSTIQDFIKEEVGEDAYIKLLQ